MKRKKKLKSKEKFKDAQTKFIELTCVDGKSPWEALELMSTGTDIGDVFFALDNISQMSILTDLGEWAERDVHEPPPAKTFDARVKEIRVK
jgi:hypothetical protein